MEHLFLNSNYTYKLFFLNHHTETMQIIWSTVKSSQGASVGLAPANKASRPQTETGNIINQWRFCQFLECQAHPYKCQPPAETQSPLLKTFWWRFWLSSRKFSNKNSYAHSTATCSTIGSQPFFYPVVYRDVQNDTKAFTVRQKANNAEFTKFCKYRPTLALFWCEHLCYR